MLIKNRKNKRLSITIDKMSEDMSELAFVMHGLGGFKEQLHIRTMIDALKNNNYNVISFDTTNTFGKSDGSYSDATVTSYYEDLEDVISWALEKFNHNNKFILAGHSVGGLSVALFAEKYPEKVKALIPVSAVISGELWKLEQKKEMLNKWREDGIWIREAGDSANRNRKELKWTFVEDIMQYDLLKDVDRLTMPVLLIVGEKDPTATVSHQEIFFSQLPGEKELHIIKNAHHVFRDKLDLEEIENIMTKWIGKI